VAPSQVEFVSGVAESLAEAAEHPGAKAIPWAVYADEEPVGFVMVANDVEDPAYVPHYLWKLLIDVRHQGRGYGAATLDRVVEFFRGHSDAAAIITSAHLGEGGPIAFYERYGFERTGEVRDGEVVLRYVIR